MIDPELRFGRREGGEGGRVWRGAGTTVTSSKPLLLFSCFPCSYSTHFEDSTSVVFESLSRWSVGQKRHFYWSGQYHNYHIPLIVTFRTPWLEIIQLIGLYFQSPVVPTHNFTQLMSTLVICLDLFAEIFTSSPNGRQSNPIYSAII